MAKLHLHIACDPIREATHFYHTVEIPDNDPRSQARALVDLAREHLDKAEGNFGVSSNHARHAREVLLAAVAALECFGEEVEV